MTAASSQLTVWRTSTTDIQWRQIILTLDGAPLATLKFGQSVTRTLVPGKHTLRADNTFQKKTFEFTLAPEEHLQIMTINRAGRLSWFLIFLFGVGPIYVTITSLAASEGQSI